MALVLKDRVQETATANTTVSFTCTGAVTGFQAFSVIGNTNTTFYTATDVSGNWESGVGTYTTAGNLVTRTTILASSNAGSAVTFSGSVTLFVNYPATKSVNLDASGNVSGLGTVASGTWQGSTVGVAYGGTGVTASTGADSVVLRDANENIIVNSVTQELTSTISSATITTLTAASSHFQVLTGTTTQTYKLPDATSLPTGATWIFDNDSTGNLTITDNAGATVDVVAAGGYATVFLEANGTVGGEWGRFGMVPSEVNWGTNSLNLGGLTVITNGTWNGATIAYNYGGTGLTSFAAANNALYSTSASALTAGTLPVLAGGTGSTDTPTAGGVGYGTGTAYAITAAGTTGQVLTSNGASAPTWSTSSSLLGQTNSASPFETALGYQAGNVNTGVNNVFVGYQSGLVNTTGQQNSAVGSYALYANTTGINNTAVGYAALYANTTGQGNTAQGTSALGSNTTGIQNTAVGSAALQANTTGQGNTAQGNQALYLNTTGYQNTAQGQQALRSNTTGINNTAIGYTAGNTITTGTNNLVLGYNAQASSATVSNENTFGNSSSTSNRFWGDLKMGGSSTGTAGQVLTSAGAGASPTWSTSSALLGATDSASPFETALGYQAGNVNTGANNTFVGYQSGLVNTTGANNVAVGVYALTANTTGASNVAIGRGALRTNTVGTQNTAVGREALTANTTGTGNTAHGYYALSANTTGSYSTAVGLQALFSNTTGAYNTAVGLQALYSNTTGEGSTAQGYYALYSNTTGAYNTAQGYQALYSNTTGGQNTAVGYAAGHGVGTNANTTGTNNTFLGYQAVGASATASNVITLGNSSIATLRCQVTTITALSDARDKTDIAELDAGLDFINALAPVSFTWDMRDGGKVNEPDTGFIAQELVKAQEDTGHYIPGLVYDENPDRLEAGYGKLIPVLVKAIQELSAKVSALKSQLNGANNG